MMRGVTRLERGLRESGARALVETAQERKARNKKAVNSLKTDSREITDSALSY
jgi:hypothetical protein